jgi:DNA repair protein RecN (Recombination protein N)
LLQPYCGYQESLPQLVERLQSLQIELKDILSELEGVNEQVQHDPQRLEQLNERIALGYRLQKKHNVNSTAALLELMADLERKLQAVLEIDASIKALQEEMQRLEKESQSLAQQISEGRKKQVKPLVQKVNQLLHRVGMPNASLKVQLEDMPLGEHGMDKVEFLFDANKSNRFEPVGKVASGGELSRLMLCIKSLVAGSLDLPTLIFDEIDTGISGEAAKQVGILLRELSGQRQVICITHQPQIAGKATAHFLVYKEISGDSIKTNIRLLTQDERITAIAKMLSGEKPTAAALENAREMVSN